MRPSAYAIDELVPQGPPMVLLEAVTAHDETSISATVTIRPGSMFCRGGGVPAHVGIEYMAQACAAFSGLEARLSGGQPQIGLLLGTRNFSAERPFFAIGETLSVSAAIAYREDGMGVFDCCIRSDGEPAARASLTVYQPREAVGIGIPKK